MGVASVVGTLRFVRGWSIKPLIYWALGVTLPLTVAVHWRAPESFAGVLGLAWDCGAVTTGPVTVPCVIALGVGITAAAKTKTAAAAVLLGGGSGGRCRAREDDDIAVVVEVARPGRRAVVRVRRAANRALRAQLRGKEQDSRSGPPGATAAPPSSVCTRPPRAAPALRPRSSP